MRILLIDPPFYRFIGYYNRYFPLGLAYLAAVLKDKGHTVSIYDADFTPKATEMEFSYLEEKYPDYIEAVSGFKHPIWQEVRNKIKDFRPDLVGITMMTTKAASAFRIAEICKDYNKDMPVVVGGPHPTVRAEEVLRISPHIDFVVKGEGEKTFPELISAIENNQELKKINPPQELVENLDTIPYPTRDLLENKDFYSSEDMGLIMTGRGCPYNCTFCSSKGIWGQRARFRSVKNVIDEIKEVKARYNTRQFSFKDDIFTINREWVVEFCESLISQNLKINWDANARVNLIDKEMLILMKKAGCNGLKVGIESGNQRILNLMKKGTTLKQIKKAASLLRKSGIHWTGYFMLGLPTETKEEMLDTLDLMKEIKPDYASVSVYEPFPGTELYDIGLDMGLVAEKRCLDELYNMSPKYYYMKDVNNRIDTMTNEEFLKIEKHIKDNFHKHNSGLSRIIKRAKARSSLYLKEPSALFSDFKKFLAWK